MLLHALTRSVLGWAALLRGDPEWRDRFSLSPAGLALAASVYVGIVLISLALESAQHGGLSADYLVTSALRDIWPLGALSISVLATGLVLRWPVPALHLLVPGFYALSLAMLATIGIVAIVPALAFLVLIALGAMLFRLGRTGGQLGAISSAAFAVFTLLLLVGLPVSLYMLTVRIEPP